MIDLGCFDTAVHGTEPGGHWVANPHPEVAEEQIFLFGIGDSGDVCVPSSQLGRSPYPRVVEEQFNLGIE